jgi:O-antigen/teichoic acid export membrane protein
MNRFSLTVMRNSAWGLVAQFAIKLMSFAFSVLVIRKLGADAFGQYAAVGAFGAIFMFVADLGLSPYMVRQLARWRSAPDGHEQAQRLYGTIVALRILLSCLAAILIILAAWLTQRPAIMIGAISLNAVTLILYGIQGTSESALAGFERFDLSAGAKIANQFVFVLLGGLALWLGIGYYGLILANLLGVALMTFVCWRGVRSLRLEPRGFSASMWPPLLRASLPFGLIGFALGLSYKFDSVLLNIFRSDAETGWYNAAYNLVFSAAVLSNVFNTALYPSLAREALGAPEKLLPVLERGIRYLMIVALPIAVGVSVLADGLIAFLFKTGFAPAAPILQIIIWTVPFMYTSELLGYVVLITDQERRAARSVLVSTGFNIVLNLLLVPRFGFFAAASMTVVTEAVLVGQHAWTLRALMQRINWVTTLLRPLAAAALMGVITLMLRSRTPLLVDIILSAGAYGALLLVLGSIGRDEFHYFSNMNAPSKEAVGQ